MAQHRFLFASVLGRRSAELFFEDLGKVVHIQNTYCSSHGGNAAASLFSTSNGSNCIKDTSHHKFLLSL